MLEIYKQDNDSVYDFKIEEFDQWNIQKYLRKLFITGIEHSVKKMDIWENVRQNIL